MKTAPSPLQCVKFDPQTKLYIEQSAPRHNYFLRGVLFFGCLLFLFKLIHHRSAIENANTSPKALEINDKRAYLEIIEEVFEDKPQPIEAKTSLSGRRIIPLSRYANDKPKIPKYLAFEPQIRTLTNCTDKNLKAEFYLRGDYWILRNYIRAIHGDLRCSETITFVTHSDTSHLVHLIPILERWLAPVSVSVYTTSSEFQSTFDSINYIRHCSRQSFLIRKFVTFHIFLKSSEILKDIPKSDEIMSENVDCSKPPPHIIANAGQLHKTQQNVTYPVNVARNIARDAALTHFLFVCDIELYPSPGLPRRFLEMIARNEPALTSKSPKVFPLAIFEVNASSHVTWTKTELQGLFRKGKIVSSRTENCTYCHQFPATGKWMAIKESEGLNLLNGAKPSSKNEALFFIGTNNDPNYDENTTAELGLATQSRQMSSLGYEFYTLNNAFVVFKSVIKV